MKIYEQCVWVVHWEVIRFFGRGDSVSWHHFVVLTDTRSHLEDWWLLAKHKRKVCGETVRHAHWMQPQTVVIKLKGERSEGSEGNSKSKREVLPFFWKFANFRNRNSFPSSALDRHRWLHRHAMHRLHRHLMRHWPHGRYERFGRGRHRSHRSHRHRVGHLRTKTAEMSGAPCEGEIFVASLLHLVASVDYPILPAERMAQMAPDMSESHEWHWVTKNVKRA